ncbi:MAG: hypothetical protein QXU18_11245 [Thermoplasmatales archaeon]
MAKGTPRKITQKLCSNEAEFALKSMEHTGEGRDAGFVSYTKDIREIIAKVLGNKEAIDNVQ